MASSQTLSEDDRRLVATWAADCAEHVIHLFEADPEASAAIADALARTRAFGAGESTAAAEISRRMLAVKAAGEATTPAGAAAARSVAQASAVAHMGAHALGAAGYAAKAVGLASDEPDEAIQAEIAWQFAQVTPEQRRALVKLPKVGTNEPGPLGPGLLSKGVIGQSILELQTLLRAH